MQLFQEYQLSQRTAAGHVHLTQRLGLVPLFVALVMMFAHPGLPAPGLWAALGLSIGLQLLLAGCHGLCFARHIGSRPGTFLALTSDRWFPLFLFAMQSAFMFVTIGLIWFTLLDLGFPTTLLLQLNLLLFFLSIPACRFFANIAFAKKAHRWMVILEACRYAAIILAAIWTAGTLTLFMAPPGERMPPDQYVFAIILWLAVALIALTCIMLFVDHLLRAGKE